MADVTAKRKKISPELKRLCPAVPLWLPFAPTSTAVIPAPHAMTTSKKLPVPKRGPTTAPLREQNKQQCHLKIRRHRCFLLPDEETSGMQILQDEGDGTMTVGSIRRAYDQGRENKNSTRELPMLCER
jgi:hypothetical protein